MLDNNTQMRKTLALLEDIERSECSVNESDASWAAAKEKEKEDRLTPKDKETYEKIRQMLDKEKKVKEGVARYKKLVVRDLKRWLELAKQNEYHIQRVNDGHYQAWRDRNGAPHMSGFWFSGNQEHEPEYWLRVPKD